MTSKIGKINPRKVILGKTNVVRKFGFKRRLVSVDEIFYYIPLLRSLQQMFRNNRIYDMCMKNITRHCGFLKNVTDGERFLKHPTFGTEKSIALNVYYDDVEICSSVGSKSVKLSVFYYSLSNLDARYRNKLCNIRLLGLTEKKVLKKYGIDTALSHFIHDIKLLNDGFDFNVNGETVNIKGNVHLVLGDTLAVHYLAGFKEGVGLSLSKCRHCHCNYDEMQTHFDEKFFQRWTLNDYVKKCTEIESAQTKYLADYLSSLYGINKRSPLCDIPDFDITKSLPQDIMHLLWEGIVQYEVKQVLKHYVIEKQKFTVKQLNEQIDAFQYNYNTVKNKPTKLTSVNLNSNDNRIRQNSSQMCTLLQILPFVLTFLGISKDCQHFQFIVQLLNITKVLLSPLFSKGSLSNLRLDISNHLQRFRQLFPTSPIIPKQHYLIHMPTCIKDHGPCDKYSCLRFEGKNKIPKTVMKVKKNFTNFAFTIADELTSVEALDFANEYHPMFANDFVPSCVKQLSSDSLVYVQEKLRNYYGITEAGSEIYKCNSITLSGIHYISSRAYLAAGLMENETLPEFGKLVKIYIVNCTVFF